ncbi:MAG: hypothetical protein KDE27_04545 [Planctomycetes bacterium]|nr:hypothetical protein [Planctomycetota bacterium]
MPHPARSVAILLFSCAGAFAQTVWSAEGNTGTNNLTTVLAQVAPGDIVELVPGTGTFPPFTLNVGIELIGPGQVVGDVVLTIPAGQRMRVADVDFLVQGPDRVSTTGDVAFEHCTFDPGTPLANSAWLNLAIASGTVFMRDCDSLAYLSGGGVSVSGGALCCITDCRFEGGNAWLQSPTTPVGYAGHPALLVYSATVIASHLTAIGGDTNCALLPAESLASAAIEVWPAATLRLSDSVATGGIGWFNANFCAPQSGANAIDSAGTAIVSRCTLTGGAGYGGPNLPTHGNVTFSTELVGLTLDQGFALGQTTTATADALATPRLLAIVGGFDATPGTVAPVNGPVFGVGGQPFVLAALTISSGQLSRPIVIPNLAALRYAEVWIQAFQLAGSVVEASPAAGGLVR